MIGLTGYLARAGDGFLAHDADSGVWYSTHDTWIAFLFATEDAAEAASNDWPMAEEVSA